MSVASKKTKKKKVPAVSIREKLGGKKKKSVLIKSKSSVKKKKKKPLRDEEETVAKKKKRAVIEEPDDVDDVDEDPDEVDIDSVDSEDEEETEEDESDVDSSVVDEDEDNIVDLSAIDPGPTRVEVGCGFNCGSCRKFVAINDPVRDDPEWLSKQNMKKANNRCPFLFPDELDVPENKKLADLVMKADTKACDRFDLDEDHASEALQKSLSIMRNMTREEVDVLFHCVESVRGLKADEDKYGYALGEKMYLLCETTEGPQRVHFEVIGFQRKKGAEVFVRALTKVKGLGSRQSIPARKMLVVD